MLQTHETLIIYYTQKQDMLLIGIGMPISQEQPSRKPLTLTRLASGSVLTLRK